MRLGFVFLNTFIIEYFIKIYFRATPTNIMTHQKKHTHTTQCISTKWNYELARKKSNTFIVLVCAYCQNWIGMPSYGPHIRPILFSTLAFALNVWINVYFAGENSFFIRISHSNFEKLPTNWKCNEMYGGRGVWVKNIRLKRIRSLSKWII